MIYIYPDAEGPVSISVVLGARNRPANAERDHRLNGEPKVKKKNKATGDITTLNSKDRC